MKPNEPPQNARGATSAELTPATVNAPERSDDTSSAVGAEHQTPVAFRWSMPSPNLSWSEWSDMRYHESMPSAVEGLRVEYAYAALSQATPPSGGPDVRWIFDQQAFSKADTGAWAIDYSAGKPILVYEKCSVIQDERAVYVLRLIAKDMKRRDEVPYTKARCPYGYAAVIDSDNNFTGYYREIATGEVVTFDDEWDKADERVDEKGEPTS